MAANDEFKVVRVFTNNYPSNIIVDRAGVQVIGTKHYGDSSVREAQAQCDLLNLVYCRGFSDGMDCTVLIISKGN